ncbi:phosphate acetyltransferase [Companilactobacillus sp. RD055328]|uniref:phosphate acetyltransferase n=1 Tax=Companilactobacillus sp. RD055328 TaxID=2916634 RepID=UPI001FC85F03|nr:phosphate acetyltransferase [Companilactobacillus sp. RD055328]GKQ43011.1 phosphate acetyltransferase [Companilactobacillus sp. RD055328]
MDLFESLKTKITGKNLRIVLPEGDDPRIMEAAARLHQEGTVVPVLLGNKEQIVTEAAKINFDLADIEIINPDTYADFDKMVDAFVERRKGKNTAEQAQTMLKDPNYFGTMLVHMDIVDGLVSGAAHPTGDTVRPALQIIKTKPGVSRTAGSFIMQKGEERYLFTDCAININPNAQELAEIAVEAANTAKIFDIDEKVAMLSFSTKGSAKSEEVDKVAQATKIAHELAPDLEIDGELQFDAAISPVVAKTKVPDSKIAGNAKIFVFPDLEAGNIGYKIAQRMGGYEAIGPVLQGMNKPISDLSRGADAEDVYKVSILTAAQTLI